MYNNFVPTGATVGTFLVGEEPDTTPPTASVDSGSVVLATSTITFHVTYVDGAGQMKVATIGNGDVRVTGPNGFDQSGTVRYALPNADTSPITATYRLTVSGGQGPDSITEPTPSHASQPGERYGGATFLVAGLDRHVRRQCSGHDAADRDAGPNSVAYDASTATFNVTYADSIRAVKFSTIGTGDIRVTGPASFDQIATFISATLSTNGTPIVATYRLTAPGGVWGLDNLGTYFATMESDGVSDMYDNFVAAEHQRRRLYGGYRRPDSTDRHAERRHRRERHRRCDVHRDVYRRRRRGRALVDQQQ